MPFIHEVCEYVLLCEWQVCNLTQKTAIVLYCLAEIIERVYGAGECFTDSRNNVSRDGDLLPLPCADGTDRNVLTYCAQFVGKLLH